MQNLLTTEIKKEGVKIAERELYEMVQAKSGLVKKFYSLDTLTDPQAKRLQSEEQDIKTVVAYQQTITGFIDTLQSELQAAREEAKMWHGEYIRQANLSVETTETFITKFNGLRKAS